jgi:hypothetical protein
MKDIAVIIPVHKLKNDTEKSLLINAINNVKKCQENYEYKLNTYIVTPLTLDDDVTNGCTVIKNDSETDFCSQVNLGASTVTEDYFSILEYDDEYNEKWFSMAHKYFYSNEDVSVFLPINIQIISKENYRQFANEAPWAMQFSQEIGFVDFKCLENYYGINLTGGIFNRDDFNRIGGLKPSIQVAFNYEFLLRVTNKKLKVFIVPKEGYRHVIDRDDSLTDICGKKFTQEEADKWYALATKEYLYEEDRKIDIYSSVEDKD